MTEDDAFGVWLTFKRAKRTSGAALDGQTKQIFFFLFTPPQILEEDPLDQSRFDYMKYRETHTDEILLPPHILETPVVCKTVICDLP